MKTTGVWYAAAALLAASAQAGGFTFISPADPKPFGDKYAAAFATPLVNPGAVKHLEIDATALGSFELYVNGKLVSSEADGNRGDFLRPGFTDVRKRRSFHTYDLTPYLDPAAGATNRLAAYVGTTWFCDDIGGRPDVQPAFAANLRGKTSDGKDFALATDASWRASFDSPFRVADLYFGETFDARRNADAFTCAGGKSAVVNRSFTGVVTAVKGAEVCIRRDLALKPVEAYVYKDAEGADENSHVFGKVKRLRSYRPGEAMKLAAGETLVLDFAQNAAAVPEIVARAASGTELVFKGAEMLNDANGERSRGNDGPAGSLYRENLRKLKDDGAQVRYIFAGKGDETYRPTFTFMGYRYAAITASADVEIASVISIPVTSVAKADERGSLETGVPDVNRLIANCLWGQYSNYVNIPTDCPQRDERLGWTADTQVFAAAAFRNADVYDFLRKWMDDMRDGQNERDEFPSVAPFARWGGCAYNKLGWADAGVIVPWTCWRMTGDTRIIDENWDAMKRFFDNQCRTRYVTTDNFQYGDWVSYEQITPSGPWAEGHGWDANYILPEGLRYWDYLGACYWLGNARMLAEMADATGKADEAKSFRQMESRILTYTRAYFFESDGGLLKIFRHLQTPTLFALQYGLFADDAAKASAVAELKRNFADHGGCLQTGFLGTSILMDAVTYGANDPKLAYDLLLQHRNPSWLYSVDQGATTMWERWNSYTKESGFGPVSMNSFNHYAYGCVLDWMYGTMAGIRPGPKGGFDREFVLAPIPDARLGYVKAAYRTKNGVIRSAWRYTDGKCKWTFTVPKGATAKVRANGLESTYESGDYELELK